MTEPTPAFVGESACMHRVRALVARAASAPLSVLITGPTGAGKEMVARAIHSLSGRGRLAAVNVCAVPDTMLEATLFGHVRGAFTGAHDDGVGYFAEADGGTLFLDEIGSISLSAQAKLLRAIETREYRPVGGRSDRRSEFRLISATNEDLGALVRRGAFRADLAHRLGAFVIAVPGLEERVEDIPALVELFLVADQRWSGRIPRVEPGALGAFMAHPWPGNVRELRQVLQVAVVLGDGVRLREGDVRAALALASPPRTAVGSSAEREELVALLERSGWDTAVAAEHARVHRVTIYRRMERLGVKVRHPRR